MSNAMNRNFGRLALNRRRFFEGIAALGLTTALLPGCRPAEKADTEDIEEITVETIKAAEKIIGIKLNDKERKKILKGLKRNLETYNSSRLCCFFFRH